MMDERFKDVQGVGFDLDHTLYVHLPEIKQAERAEIYKLVAGKNNVPVERAQELFESAYAATKSGGPALERCGIENPRNALRDCLDRADASRFLKTDGYLVTLLQRLCNAYNTCLITDNRKENAHKKLAALGISPALFDFGMYWDTSAARKETGEAYAEAEMRFNQMPRQLVFVGNSEGDDIIPASKRGWKTVHLSTKPSPYATASIRTIYELEGLLL